MDGLLAKTMPKTLNGKLKLPQKFVIGNLG